MDEPLAVALKFGFLAVLYLFLFWIARSSMRDLAKFEGAAAAEPAEAPGGSRRRASALPDLAAGCSLASTIDAAQLRAWKAEHPGAVVVSYVNTTAEVKAESDYCCTSGNAVEVVNAISPDREILFLPDMFLGAHVRRITGRGAGTTAVSPASPCR